MSRHREAEIDVVSVHADIERRIDIQLIARQYSCCCCQRPRLSCVFGGVAYRVMTEQNGARYAEALCENEQTAQCAVKVVRHDMIVLETDDVLHVTRHTTPHLLQVPNEVMLHAGNACTVAPMAKHVTRLSCMLVVARKPIEQNVCRMRIRELFHNHEINF